MICHFVEAKLSQKPRYEALSYRWSDPNQENPDLVYCNGFECPVGSNLCAALIRFRLADVPRALWVDQLCIDQAEGPEKAQQLLIMGDIYSKAERVLAWLGPAYDDSDKAMDLFPKLVDRLQTLDPEKKMEPALWQISSLPELERNNRRALYKLFSRQYFGRVWTLQELAVSNDIVIVCGDAEFPFAVLERFSDGYQANNLGYCAHALHILYEGEGNYDPENPRRPIITHLQVVLTLRALDSSAFQSSSARILNLLRDLECSKSDDRVYSILRFLPFTLAQNLAVVKRKSTEALFIDLATFELTQNRSMYFLAAAGMCQHRRWCSFRKDDQLRPILKLPTWVPDWTCSIVIHGLWMINDDFICRGYTPLYQATDISRGDARLTVVDDTKTLCVQGKIFDEIAACLKPYDASIVSKKHREDGNLQVQDMTKTQMMEYRGDSENNDTVEDFIVEQLKLQADSCMALARFCKMYGDDTGRTTACRQTLNGGMIPRRLQSFDDGVMAKATDEEANELSAEWDIVLEANELLKRTPEVMRRPSNPQGPGLNEEDMLFLSRCQEMAEKMNNSKWPGSYPIMAMSLACKGRRFFTTTKGFMCLAPDIAQVGDKVCLISGCCTPFIIRAEGPNFCLVGESYVHGVMDGELMSDITFEDINLV